MLYEEIKSKLPEDVTAKLDPIFNQDTVDNFKYFMETCNYLRVLGGNSR
ncbi:MAG: hypothetical protein ACI4EL_00515 [Candidatus Fimimorpha sp.]